MLKIEKIINFDLTNSYKKAQATLSSLFVAVLGIKTLVPAA